MAPDPTPAQSLTPVRPRTDGRHLLPAAGLATVPVGLVSGLLARAAMRGVAVVTGQPVELSLGGTLGIVLVFVLLAGALATGYAMVAGRVRRPGALGLGLPTVAAATLFLAVLELTPLRSELGDRAPLLPLFLPAVLALGSGGAIGTELLARRLRPRRVYAVPAVVGAVLVPLMMVLGVLQSTGVIPVPPT